MALVVDGGGLVNKGGALGTGQACCCNKCSGPCDGENPCPPGCVCVDGQCVATGPCCVPVTAARCCWTLEDGSADGFWRKYVTEEEQEAVEQQCADSGGTITDTFIIHECRTFTEELCQEYGGQSEDPCGGTGSLCYPLGDESDDCLLDVSFYETREEADAAVEALKDDDGVCIGGPEIVLRPHLMGGGGFNPPFTDVACEWEPGGWDVFFICCTEENPLP